MTYEIWFSDDRRAQTWGDVEVQSNGWLYCYDKVDEEITEHSKFPPMVVKGVRRT